ncbi:MAG: aminodeoxychorismate/anthranilate synthase component II [Nakamurella sp.]
MTRIVVIDNYDSFVYNLVQYLQQLGADTVVYRNDVVTVAEVSESAPDGVLISPGPGVPADAGISEELISWAASTDTPLLGVCLGHQAIAEVYGGVVDRAAELMHGRTSQVRHDGSSLFTGLPESFTATRYHSLAVVEGTLPSEIEVTARTVDGAIMAVRHIGHPIVGVQFHPESVLTQGGHRMLANWLVSCGDDAALGRVPALEVEVERLRLSAG